MSAGPRTQRLVAWNATAAGFGGQLACPANMVVIVKSAYFFNYGSASATGQINCYVSGGQDGMGFVNVSIPQSGVVGWQGWLVLNPGDYISPYFSAGSMTVWVSGAVLQGPTLVPPLHNP